MILANVAARYTRIPASQTASLVAAGATIKVHGIIVTGAANSTVTVLEGDGTTVIGTIAVLSGTSFEQRTTFIAHKGLAITTPANCTCTVFHTNASA